MTVTIGFQVIPMHGEIPPMRDAWMEAEALGVDRLYTSDHLNALVFDTQVLEGDQYNVKETGRGQCFEGMAIQAAMAATTTRPEIGCIVIANSYRNPKMLAHIASTIDHLSRGRFILGIGTGYFKPDYDSVDLPYGTQTSRAQDLARDLPVFKTRLYELKPKPLRKMPIMVASMGEKIGMGIVAEHADIWHAYGPLEKLEAKIELLHQRCAAIGRDPAEIEFATYFLPDLLKDADLDKYVALGFKHIVCLTEGPYWDRGQLREVLAWRKALT